MGNSVSQLAKNSSLYLIANLIAKTSIILLIPFYSWFLIPEDFGVIFLVQTIAMVFSLFVGLALNAAIQRFFYDIKNIDDIKTMYSTIVIFLFLIGVLVYSILFIFSNELSNFIEIQDSLYLELGLLYSFLSLFYPLFTSLFYVLERVKILAKATIFLSIILVVSNIACVMYFDDKIFGYLFSYIIYNFIQIIVLWILSKKYLVLRFDIRKLIELLKYSIQFLPSSVSGWVVSFSDRLILNKIIGAAATGIYSTGYSIGSAPNIIVNSINQAYVPFTYSNYTNLNSNSLKSLKDSITYLFIFYTILYTTVIYFVNDFILLLGPQYRDSELVIIVVLIAYLFNSYKLIIHNPMSYIIPLVKYKSLIWIFTAILNIALNIVLIPRYSYNGAAYSTMISFAFTLIPIIFFSQKAIRINIDWLLFLKVLFFSTMFLGSLYVVDFVLGVKIIIYLVYLLIIFRISDFSFSKLKGYYYSFRKIK